MNRFGLTGASNLFEHNPDGRVFNSLNQNHNNMSIKLTITSAAFALLITSCGGSEEPAKTGKEQAKEMSDALMDEMEATDVKTEETAEDTAAVLEKDTISLNRGAE